MSTDARFDHLRQLAGGTAAGVDAATLPPEAFEAWRRDGVRFGKFVVLGEVGRGGTGVVHRAWQHDLRREVALKVVSGLHPELRERFLREARVGAGLAHPAILPVYEAGESDASLWLAMPLVKGRPLDECGLEAAEAARAVAAAARGVQAAHDAGVIHRDLKPRNIMREDGGAVRVMDFGLALTREDATRISVTGQVLGTPAYMAPEQAAGGAADARTDVYGLGATLYRLVAGRAPYEVATLQAFLSDIASRDPAPPSRFAAIPPPLETVVLKAMDRDPARRYASAAALADDLERFARGEPVLARPASLADRGWRMLRRRRPWVAAAAACLALAAAGLSIGRYTMKSAAPGREPAKAEAPAPIQAEAALEAARELRQRNLPEEAIAAYTDAQRRFPEIWKCWAECGEYRRELGDHKGAEGDLTRALALRPADTHLLAERGQSRIAAGNLDGAEADFEHAIQLAPAALDGYMGRSNVREIRGDVEGAKADLDTAVNLEPRNIWPRRYRAALLVKTGDLAGAIREWDETIRQVGEAAIFLVARGSLKLRTRDFAGAVADFEKAKDLDPGMAPTCDAELQEARAALKEGERK